MFKMNLSSVLKSLERCSAVVLCCLFVMSTNIPRSGRRSYKNSIRQNFSVLHGESLSDVSGLRKNSIRLAISKDNRRTHLVLSSQRVHQGNITISSSSHLSGSTVNEADASKEIWPSLLRFLSRLNASEIIRFSHDMRKTEVVKLGRGDVFSKRLRDAGIQCFAWVDPEQELFDDVPWVQHTASWWKRNNKSINVGTIQDMIRKQGYYESVATNFVVGNFTKAARLLSASHNGVDAWPCVAAIENAMIFSEGQIHNGTHLVHGK